jgi:hypothetical protein
MSDGPTGSGWWQASDGLWYPPETHPSRAGEGDPPTGPIDVPRTPPEGIPAGRAVPPGSPRGLPPAPPPPPGYGTPPGGDTRLAPRPAPPLPDRGGRPFGAGCLFALLVVVGLAIVTVLAARYVVDRAREEVPEAVGRAVDGARSGVDDAVDDAIGDVVGGPCDFLTEAQAEAVLGEAKVVGLGRAVSAARPVLDDRILPDAPTCWVAAANGRVARVARLGAGDAAARFDAEAAKARRGPRPYFAGAVRGFRDEAFCTTITTTGAAGVLARRGDRLVYASVTPDLTRSPGGIDRVADRVAAQSCKTARGLARAALG